MNLQTLPFGLPGAPARLEPPARLLHTLFAEQAALRPQHPALVTLEQSLSYAELLRRATHLAHWLRGQHAAPNRLVAVVMDKGWEQVAAVLGILQAGAAYLPIDAEWPAERRAQLLAQGEVELVLTQSWLEPSLAWPAGVKLLAVDSFTAAEPVIPLEPIQTETDLAYVMFTSGSTGQPKGVMIDHRGAVNTILDINRRFQVGPADRVLAISSLCFDLSVYDIFGLLAAGGTLVLPAAAEKADPAHWAALLNEPGVTIWNSVPALMELLVCYTADRMGALPPHLRLALLSGDWIPLTLPRRMWSLSSSLQIVSLGGATEASIWSILYPIEKVAPEWKSIPYGHAMANQTVHILDANLEPCPPGVTGRLHIGGIGLAQGYWRNPERTAAGFIEHPRTGERLYDTGDLGCYLPDGNVEFLGREDFQVKVQGHRIELAEIENVLAQHPHVHRAVVNAVGETQGDKRLVAYVVPVPNVSLTTEELRGWVAQKLPDYMVPSLFVTMRSLPLTPNGKVDRRALPLPTDARPATKKAYQPPANKTQQVLCEIWSDVLGLKEIGIDDNFFELGGHSLLLTRVMFRITQVFEVSLPLRKLFESPTVAAQAALVDQSQDQPPAPAPASAYPVPANPWADMFDQLSPGELDALYHNLIAQEGKPI